MTSFQTPSMKLAAYLMCSHPLIGSDTDLSDETLRHGKTFFKFHETPSLTAAVAQFDKAENSDLPLMADLNAFWINYQKVRKIALRVGDRPHDR